MLQLLPPSAVAGFPLQSLAQSLAKQQEDILNKHFVEAFVIEFFIRGARGRFRSKISP